jgi:hypothetical protein
MKKIVCNLCGKILVAGAKKRKHFTVNITSPYINIFNRKAHCCEDCYEKMLDFFNIRIMEDAFDEDDQDAGNI